MSVNDPIGDMICRINNAIRIKSERVEMPSSKIKTAIAQILKTEGYINEFENIVKGAKKSIKLNLKYGRGKKSVISQIKRISTPGRHVYKGADSIPRLMGGFGTVIVSTSKGLMTDRQARENKVGGEILIYVG